MGTETVSITDADRRRTIAWAASILGAAAQYEYDELERLAFLASPAERRAARGMAETVIHALDRMAVQTTDLVWLGSHRRG